MKDFEIPFGAKDSELINWEFTIPEGMYAETKDGKVIIKKTESEDERIRKEIVRFIQMEVEDEIIGNKWIAWLEKQGKQKPAWSEGDENILEAITYTVKYSGMSHCLGVSIKVMFDWLKSLKDRVYPQPKQEWSEED